MSVELVGEESSTVLSLLGESYRSDHETSDSESDSSVSVISFSTTSSESEESSADEDKDDDDDAKDKDQDKDKDKEEIDPEEKAKKKKKVKENPKVKGELSLDDLPRIEDLHISVPQESTRPIGFIKSFVVPLVVIEGLPNLPALNIDTVLFLEKGDRALGHIFDIFGPVKQPYYCVRFNSKDHIDEKGIKVGMEVYCAPSTPHTIYVLVAQLQQMKGTDASWADDYERPDEEQDFSDDEKEHASRKNGTNTTAGPTNGQETQQQDRQIIRPHRRGNSRGRGGQIKQIPNSNHHYRNGWSYAPVNSNSAPPVVPFYSDPRHQSRSRPNLAHSQVPQQHQQPIPPYVPTLLVPGFYPPKRYPFQQSSQYDQYPNHSGGMEIIHQRHQSRYELPPQPIYSQAHLPYRSLPPPPPPPPPAPPQIPQYQQIIPSNQHTNSNTPTPAQFMKMFQDYYPALYQQQQQAFLNNYPTSTSTTIARAPIKYPSILPNTNSTLTHQTHNK